MKESMSNTVKILLIVIISLLVAGILIYTLFFAIPIGSPVKVDGNIVNNEFNNLLSGGQFCRLENKLYFNYEKTREKNGLIEISENGAKRIFQKKHIPVLGLYGLTNDPIFTSDGKLFKVSGNEWLLQCYESGFKDVISLKAMDGWQMADPNQYFCKDDEIFFCINVSEANEDKLIKFKHGKSNVVAENVDSFYITEKNEIFYLFFGTDECTFFRYNQADKQSNEIIRINRFPMNNFIVENNFLICVLDDHLESEIAILDLSHPDMGFKIIEQEHHKNEPKPINPSYVETKPNYKRDESIALKNASYNINKDYLINSFNAFDNNIYISTNIGLYMYNMLSEKKVKLVDGNIKSSYIVDDKYIYYVKNDETLWRITEDKCINEKVYG